MAESLATITIPVASLPIKAEIVTDKEVLPQLAFSAADQDTDALSQCEAILQKYGDAAWESAAAVAEIIDRRLYQAVGYSRFSDYCSERLGVGKSWAYRLKRAHDFMQMIDEQTERAGDSAMPDPVENEDATRVSAPTPNGQESANAITSAAMAAISPAAAAELAMANLPAEAAVAVVAELSATASSSGNEAITTRAARKRAKEEADKKKAEEEAQKAATEPPKPAPPPVSEAMQAVDRALENGVHGQKVLQQIRNAMKALRDLEPLPGLEIVTARKDSILRYLESSANALSGYLPAMPCPKCQGEKCPDCGNMGWLNKSAQRSLTHQR